MINFWCVITPTANSPSLRRVASRRNFKYAVLLIASKISGKMNSTTTR